MSTEEIQIHKGRPIPEPVRTGARHAVTNVLARMEEGDSIDLPYSDQKAKSDMYAKAKTAKVKVTLRVVVQDGTKILRVWRIPKEEPKECESGSP